MVGALVFGQFVFLDIVVEGDETLLLSAVVADDNLGRVDIFHHTVGLGVEQHTAVVSYGFLDTGSDNRNLGVEQRNSLTHHVRSHQGSVGIVVLQERDERCGDGCNLVGCDVYEVNLVGRHNGEVGLTTGLDTLNSDVAFLILRSGGLSHCLVLFGFGREIDGRLVEHHLAILDALIRRFDKAKLVNLCVDAK